MSFQEVWRSFPHISARFESGPECEGRSSPHISGGFESVSSASSALARVQPRNSERGLHVELALKEVGTNPTLPLRGSKGA